ncbi:HNH endonuclease [Dethiothermospora halolimnae]|uniref:HNH endonuclease n=1 Tax=Dethiothermospora halolimnae TaxID=3114390 RepID=UPI003CCBAF4F
MMGLETLTFRELEKEGLKNSSFDIPKFSEEVESYKIDSFEEADKPLYLDSRNEELEGHKHPETGIKFNEKKVELLDGREVTGVFPEFETPFQIQIDESLYNVSDRKQFEVCNDSLKKAIASDMGLKNKFTKDQIEQIIGDEVPDGYTWHHNEEPGVMQLVDTEVHGQTGHTGGRFIWGGGSKNR